MVGAYVTKCIEGFSSVTKFECTKDTVCHKSMFQIKKKEKKEKERKTLFNIKVMRGVLYHVYIEKWLEENKRQNQTN